MSISSWFKSIFLGSDFNASASLPDAAAPLMDSPTAFDSSDQFSSDSLMDSSMTTINPATGLPMINGMGGVDVGGNTYGSDDSSFSMSDSLSSSSSMFDDFPSSSSSFDSSSSSSSMFDDFSSSSSSFDSGSSSFSDF